MNAKEMSEALTALTARVEEQGRVINVQGEVIVQVQAFLESWPVIKSTIEELNDRLDVMDKAREMSDGALSAQIEEARATHDVLSSLLERFESISEKVEARNRSAPVKRNMTDDDARRVLDGEFKDLDHKSAAEVIGLTYAQVYSCRLEFTFKHVHKLMREANWTNPWARKK